MCLSSLVAEQYKTVQSNIVFLTGIFRDILAFISIIINNM